jgi:hypothetical protein
VRKDREREEERGRERREREREREREGGRESKAFSQYNMKASSKASQGRFHKYFPLVTYSCS